MVLDNSSFNSASTQAAPLLLSPCFPLGEGREEQRGAGTAVSACRERWCWDAPAPCSLLGAWRARFRECLCASRVRMFLQFVKIRSISQLPACCSPLTTLLCLHSSCSFHRLFSPPKSQLTHFALGRKGR